MAPEDEENSQEETEQTHQEDGEEKIIPFSQAGQQAEDEPQEAHTSDDEAEVPEDQAQAQASIIEALLFATERPLTSGDLADLSGAEDGHEARRLVERLQDEYESAGRAFCIEEVAGGFRMVTRPDYSHWVSKLKESDQQETLSQAAMETLAIVAYRQPITRAEIEDVRGVQSNYILRSLIEKGLVRVTGKSDELGRPLLYGTSRKFLEVFGLDSLDGLPNIEELNEE